MFFCASPRLHIRHFLYLLHIRHILHETGFVKSKWIALFWTDLIKKWMTVFTEAIKMFSQKFWKLKKYIPMAKIKGSIYLLALQIQSQCWKYFRLNNRKSKRMQMRSGRWNCLSLLPCSQLQILIFLIGSFDQLRVAAKSSHLTNNIVYQ